MLLKIVVKQHSNMTSFFRFVKKRAIYRLGIISLAHALVHVTDFLVCSNLAIRQPMLKLEVHSGFHELFQF
jgi:hypothetical protein